jgi:hypothetical protein
LEAISSRFIVSSICMKAGGSGFSFVGLATKQYYHVSVFHAADAEIR